MNKSLLAIAVLCTAPTAKAAELNGIAMPDTQEAGGAHLVLNGMALRNFSFLGLHVYVAGLYLQHRTDDPDAILGSSDPKLLTFTFTRDVGQALSRRSWRDSLDQSCRQPCQLPAREVETFLASVPAIHAGDTSAFLFTPGGLEVSMNGHVVGRAQDPLFARVILSTFIGPHPTAPEVKRELLGRAG